MLKTNLIKVKNIENEEIIMAVTLTKIITVLMKIVTMIMMIMRIKIGNSI